MTRIGMFLVLALVFARADDITLRDGTVYRDAKVVSHDATTVTILYAEGGATLPIAKLPDDLQKKFGVDSGQGEPQPAAHQADNWNGYRQAQDKYVMVGGRLVTRSSANVVTLNVKLNHLAEMKSAAGENLGRGALVDIYQGETAAATDPSMFKPTGASAFLKDYVLASDKIVKVEAVKTGATESGNVYYVVVQPFSFDAWKKAGSPQ